MNFSYLKKIKSPFLRYGLLILTGGIALMLCFVASVYLGLWGPIPSKQALGKIAFEQASEVYTADSVLIGKYYIRDRQPVDLEELPEYLPAALISIEDRRFYDHRGIDYPSLFRVGIKTLLLGDRSAGGGSTLSQQLAKNLYPRQGGGKLKLVVDKFKEMITARRLEAVYDKSEILELYLNTVAFGENSYGIESAALKYFGKAARELSLNEAATLVGMLKATYSYNPRLFPERSKTRRNTVLQAMADTDYISEQMADSLAGIPIDLEYRQYDHNHGLAPYFREEVRKQVIQWCKNQNQKGDTLNIYTSGLKIYTTLDSGMQELAEAAMMAHMRQLQSDFETSYGDQAPWLKDEALRQRIISNSEPYKKYQNQGLSAAAIQDSMRQKKTMILEDWNGPRKVTASSIDSLIHYSKFLNTGSLSLDPVTGGIKTWVGGINYRYYKYDHISQSKRQVGSTFKPLVYTAALEQGIAACTHFSAEQLVYKNLEDWSPSNSSSKDETYLNYSMEEGLSKSVNTVAVKVLEAAGIPNVIQLAQKLGISAVLPARPSLALGTGEISLLELAGAYASYVNESRAVQPFLITGISDSQGEVLFEASQGQASEPAYSEENRQLMLEMMRAVVEEGTASRIRYQYKLPNAVAGKTGTTQNNKDAWFAAITPKLVHLSWVGLDNHEIGFKNTRLGQGANAALPLFARWMQELNKEPRYNAITRAKFSQPSDRVLAELDCEPVERDGFFKRLFKNPKKKRTKKFRQRKSKS